MRERPILFSGPMVRAILDGRKTQTRRVVKVRGEVPPTWATFAAEGSSLTTGGWRPSGLFYWSEEQDRPVKPLRRWPTLSKAHAMAGDHYWTPCPYGVPGDRLWVREAWLWRGRWGREAADESGEIGRPKWFGADPRFGGGPFHECVHFMADGPVGTPSEWRGMPSIHMPRWASRLSLDVAGVRVERLQDVSEEDIAAEGVTDESVRALWDGASLAMRREAGLPGRWLPTFDQSPPRWLWRTAWQLINGAESWAANPWVWVVEFKRAEQGARAA